MLSERGEKGTCSLLINFQAAFWAASTSFLALIQTFLTLSVLYMVKRQSWWLLTFETFFRHRFILSRSAVSYHFSSNITFHPCHPRQLSSTLSLWRREKIFVEKWQGIFIVRAKAENCRIVKQKPAEKFISFYLQLSWTFSYDFVDIANDATRKGNKSREKRKWNSQQLFFSTLFLILVEWQHNEIISIWSLFLRTLSLCES